MVATPKPIRRSIKKLPKALQDLAKGKIKLFKASYPGVEAFKTRDMLRALTPRKKGRYLKSNPFPQTTNREMKPHQRCIVNFVKRREKLKASGVKMFENVNLDKEEILVKTYYPRMKKDRHLNKFNALAKKQPKMKKQVKTIEEITDMIKKMAPKVFSGDTLNDFLQADLNRQVRALTTYAWIASDSAECFEILDDIQYSLKMLQTNEQ